MSPLLPKVLISAFFSVIYGGLSYFLFLDLPDAWRWALISALACFSLMLLMLLLQDERRARRYARAQKLLPCPPQFQVGANVREDKHVASVRICLCDSEAILLHVQKREPMLMRIPRHQVRSAELLSPVEMRLTLTDGRVLLLLTPYMEELAHHLRRAGWLITDDQA